jgi:hypothetical protein
MNMNEPLTTGCIVSLWHGNRGHMYVVAGINVAAKTLGLIKHNCINSDGNIHKATRLAGKFHKEIAVEDFEDFDGAKVATKVNRVFGQKQINRQALATFARQDVGSTTLRELKSDHEVYPPLEVTADHRAPAYFS